MANKTKNPQQAEVKEKRVNVRWSIEEYELVKMAAEIEDRSISSFVRRAAVSAAEDVQSQKGA